MSSLHFNLTDRGTSQELTKYMGQPSPAPGLVSASADISPEALAEILARKLGGCTVRTAAAALCLPCSSGPAGLSRASKGGGACSSGSSILSCVLACIPVHLSLNTRHIITYYYILLPIFSLKYCSGNENNCFYSFYMLLPISTYFGPTPKTVPQPGADASF